MINGNRTKSTRGRHIRDYYETPQQLAEAAINQLQYDEEIAYYSPVEDILDAGCGNGVWAKECIRLVYSTMDDSCYPYVMGIDLNPQITERPDLVNEVITGDFLQYNPTIRFDLIVGNPPYSLAEEFIRHSYDLLEDDGYIYFLLRLSFLEGIKRGKGLFKDLPLKRVYVCSRRPSFYPLKGRPTTDTLSYAMFLWQKGYLGVPEISWLDWEYDA